MFNTKYVTFNVTASHIKTILIRRGFLLLADDLISVLKTPTTKQSMMNPPAETGFIQGGVGQSKANINIIFNSNSVTIT